jgi:putative heme-binding domain-containing protein
LLRDTALDRAADRPLARAAALWTLGGLGGLDEPTLLRALRDLDPRVREQAVKLAEPRLRQAPDLAQTILAMALTEDGRPGFQVLLTLGELRGFAKTAAMVTLLRHVALDRWYSWAALSGLEDEGLAFLQDLVTLDAAWLEEPTEAQAWFLDQLGRLFGARHLDEEMAGLWQVLGGRAAAPGAVSLLAGLSSEFAAHRTPLRQWLAQPPTALASAPQTAERILDRAAALAGAAEATLTLRIQAVRLLAQGAPALAAQRLPALLGPGHPGELRAAAAQALLDSSDPEAAKAVFAGWRQHPTALRRRLLGAASRSAAAAAALLDALEQGRLELSEVDLPSRQALQQHGQPLVRDRAARLLREAAASDRAQVVNSYAPALQLAGDRQRGAATFARNCLVCHSVQSFGGHVGPDLSGIGERPKETLLTDVLDPSRQVSSDFLNYSVETSAGDSESGLIVAETPVSITLRRANAPDLTLLRSQVLELRAGGKSVMPDGFEQVLDHQGMADLLGFLQQPDKDLLPVEK